MVTMPGHAPARHRSVFVLRRRMTESLDVPDTAPEGGLVERASIRRNLAATTATQLVGWVLATAVAVVVPRYLGAETVGRIRVADSLWMIATVFAAFGTDQYLQLAIARDQPAGMRQVAPGMAARSGLLVLCAFPIAGYVALTDPDRTFVGMVLLLGVIAAQRLWVNGLMTVFAGLERQSSVATISVVFSTVGALASILVVVVGYGAIPMLAATALVAFAANLAIAAKLHATVRVPLDDWRSGMRRVVRASAPYAAVAFALTAYREVDVIVISRVAEPRDLGWYAAADRLFGTMLFPTTVILGTIFPTLGRLHNTDPEGMRHLVRRTYSLLFLVSVPVGFGAIAVAPTWAPRIFGDDFDGTGRLLQIYGPITVLTFATTLLGTVAVVTDRRRYIATLVLACAALTIPLDLLLVPWAADRYSNGALGGVLAYTATEGLQFVVGVALIAPYLFTFREVFRSLRIVAAGGAMLAAVWRFRDDFFVVPVAIGVAVYAAAVLAFHVIDADQRAFLRAAIRRQL